MCCTASLIRSVLGGEGSFALVYTISLPFPSHAICVPSFAFSLAISFVYTISLPFSSRTISVPSGSRTQRLYGRYHLNAIKLGVKLMVDELRLVREGTQLDPSAPIVGVHARVNVASRQP